MSERVMPNSMALIGLVTPLLSAGIGIIIGNLILKNRNARSMILHERPGTRVLAQSTALTFETF